MNSFLTPHNGPSLTGVIDVTAHSISLFQENAPPKNIEDMQAAAMRKSSSIIEEGQQSASVGTNQLLKISRDYKDVLVSLWITWEPESTWDDFRDGPLGFELITAYEADSAKFVYDVELSYEELVKSPHRVLTSVVNHLLPRQDNPELSSFGAAKRIINLDCIDQVIEESMVRTLRDGESEGLLDSVGVYKQFLAPEEVDEVNEFIANL